MVMMMMSNYQTNYQYMQTITMVKIIQEFWMLSCDESFVFLVKLFLLLKIFCDSTSRSAGSGSCVFPDFSTDSEFRQAPF